MRVHVCMCVCYRADSAGIVLLHVGTQDSVAGFSPRAQGALSLTRLLVARLLPQVVEAEGQAVPGVQETALAQVAVLRDQDLERGGGMDSFLRLDHGMTGRLSTVRSRDDRTAFYVEITG